MYPVTQMHVELWMKERRDQASRERFAAAVSAARVHRPSLVSRFLEAVWPSQPATCGATCTE